jgi:hypothetical protein
MPELSGTLFLMIVYIIEVFYMIFKRGWLNGSHERHRIILEIVLTSNIRYLIFFKQDETDLSEWRLSISDVEFYVTETVWKPMKLELAAVLKTDSNRHASSFARSFAVYLHNGFYLARRSRAQACSIIDFALFHGQEAARSTESSKV